MDRTGSKASTVRIAQRQRKLQRSRKVKKRSRHFPGTRAREQHKMWTVVTVQQGQVRQVRWLHDFILLCLRQDFTRASTGLSDKTYQNDRCPVPQISTDFHTNIRRATVAAITPALGNHHSRTGEASRGVAKWQSYQVVKSSSESTARLCLVVLCQAVPTEAQKQIVRSSRSCTCRQLDHAGSLYILMWSRVQKMPATCQEEMWYLDRRCRFKGWDLGSRRSWSQWSRSNCPAPKLWLGPMRVNAVNIRELWMVQVLLTFFFSCLHVSLGVTVDFTCQKNCCLFSDRLVCWVLPRLEHWAMAFGPSLKEQLRLGKVVADAMCHVGHFGCTRNRRVVWDC